MYYTQVAALALALCKVERGSWGWVSSFDPDYGWSWNGKVALGLILWCMKHRPAFIVAVRGNISSMGWKYKSCGIKDEFCCS